MVSIATSVTAGLNHSIITTAPITVITPENSEVSDLARELYYSSLLLQELVEWYQSRRQEQEDYEEEYEQYHGFDMTMM